MDRPRTTISSASSSRNSPATCLGSSSRKTSTSSWRARYLGSWRTTASRPSSRSRRRDCNSSSSDFKGSSWVSRLVRSPARKSSTPHKLQQQGFAQQGKDIATQYQATQQNQQSAGVAGGGLFTKGQREAVSQEAEQHLSQLSNLGRAQKSAALTFQEQMSQLQDSKKNLGILESQLGISGQEITTRTANALQQLGLSQMVSVQQVHQAMVDASQGVPNALSSIMGNIYQSSGLRPLTSAQAGGG